MFWRLLILRGHSAREPASIACDNEQGDLFYSAGQHRNLRWPQLIQGKLGRGIGKNEGDWTRNVEIQVGALSPVSHRIMKKSMSVGEASMAIF